MPRTVKTPAGAARRTGTDPASHGFAQNNAVINPYALAELITGRHIDWGHVDDKPRMLEQILQHPYHELFDPVHEGPLYLGFTLDTKGRLVRDQVAIPDHDTPNGNDRDSADAGHIRRLGDLAERFATRDIEKIAVAAAETSGSTMTLTLRLPRKERLARMLRFLRPEIIESIVLRQPNDDWTPPGGAWGDGGRFFNETAEFFDPVQGNVANCYYIAALSAVAWAMPYRIQHQTRATGETQERFVNLVRFYRPDSGGSVDKEVEVTDAVVLSGNTPMYARSSEAGEIWPGIYEKAFAKYKTGTTGDRPDILATGWGDPVWATAILTGGHRSYYGTAGMTAHDIWQTIRANSLGGRTFRPMTCWTYGSGADSPDKVVYSDANLVASHAYTILGWDYRNGVEYLVIRNPWGNHEATVGTLGGTTVMHDISWWRPIALANVDGTFAIDAGTFKKYFAGFGVVA